MFANIKKINEIAKIAKENQVNYSVAKIMYNDGQTQITKENAISFYKIFTEQKVPASTINILEKIGFKDWHMPSKVENADIIYKKVVDYADENAHIIVYNHIDQEYVLEIAKIMHFCKVDVDSAIKLFDLKVKNVAEVVKMDPTAVITSLLLFRNSDAACACAENYQINKEGKNAYKRANEYFVNGDLKNYRRKKINGITIISKSNTGLARLEQLIKEAYRKGDKAFLEVLSENAEEKKLFITDFPLTKIKKAKIDHYSSSFKYIYLTDKEDSKRLLTFFHEATHFLDDAAGIDAKYWSEYDYLTKNLLIEIKKHLHFLLPKALKYSILDDKNSLSYVNNPKINQKWLEQIKKDWHGYDDEEVKELYERKKFYERKKYNLLISSITDILDGLAGGKLYDFRFVSGHGSQYYSDKTMLAKEFLANIGEIYNGDGLDILRHELGEDLAQKIINMYQEFLDINKIKSNRYYYSFLEEADTDRIKVK